MDNKRDLSSVCYVLLRQCTVPCSCDSNILSAPLHRTCPSREIIDKTYHQFGPTPRLCFETAADNEKMEMYEGEVRGALDELTLESLRKFVDDARNLRMDATSHKLCLVRRRKKHDIKSVAHVLPITDHIRSELSLSLRNADILQLIQTYQKFFPITSARGMCGTVFENICHHYFKERILIQYTEMVRLTGKNKRHWWNTSHTTFEDQGLEGLRKGAFAKPTTLDVCPLDKGVYDGQGLTPEPGIYYIPTKPNHVAFDSFILLNDTLYIFQFAVSDEYGINNRIFEERAKLLTPKEDWVFIFVIPDKIKLLKCSWSNIHDDKEFVPCSAQIVTEDLPKPAIQESIKGEEPSPKKPRIAEAAEGSNDGEGSKLREKPKGSTIGARKGKQKRK
jgi:hypothetical protein